MYAFTVHDLSQGIRTAKFQKCTGIEMSIAVPEYSEGGALAPMKEGTRVSFANATLSRGMAEDNEFYTWCLEMADMLAHVPEGAGVDSPDQLRDFEVRQMRRSRTVAKSMPLYNCQPARFKPFEGDNESDDLQIQELEIAYEYFDIENE